MAEVFSNLKVKYRCKALAKVDLPTICSTILRINAARILKKKQTVKLPKNKKWSGKINRFNTFAVVKFVIFVFIHFKNVPHR